MLSYMYLINQSLNAIILAFIIYLLYTFPIQIRH